MVVDARTGWGEDDQRVWEETIRLEKYAEAEAEAEAEREGREGGEGGEGADEFENARRRLYRVRGGLDEGGARLGVGGDPLDGYDDARVRVATEASSILVMNKTDEMAPGDFFERFFDDDRSSDAIEIEMDPGWASEMDADGRRVDPPAAEASSSARSPLTIRASLATIPDRVRRSFAAVVVASAKTGAGLDAIETALAAAFGAGGMEAEGAAWAANRRQADALRVAEAALVRAREDAVLGGLPVDFWTIELREAANALGAVTGEEVGEDVLDVIFTKFCIGK
jgi:tRNA U34 5-carboxymethylaminomethyl modifying GTPase MnmE/TrmE